MHDCFSKSIALVAAAAIAVLPTGSAFARDRDDFPSKTPIKHIVVIFQENVSFDHYFGTYPKAMNLPGETPFSASKHTPKVNNLVTPLDVSHNFGPLAGLDLLNHNPNSNPNAPAAPNNNQINRAGASNR